MSVYRHTHKKIKIACIMQGYQFLNELLLIARKAAQIIPVVHGISGLCRFKNGDFKFLHSTKKPGSSPGFIFTGLPRTSARAHEP